MGKNILLVDNDQQTLDANKKALEAEGFEIRFASTSLDALDKLVEQRPDLIITEIILEHMDSGFNLCYQAKRKYPDVPIIILSEIVRKTGITFSLGTKEEKNWIKADEFIHKPINSSSLACRVNRQLRLAQESTV